MKIEDMSINLKNKKVDTEELLEKYFDKELDETALLKEFAYAEFYYSTFDDNLYSGVQKHSHGYLPLFVTKEDCKAFYEKGGREDCVIIRKTFLSIIESTMMTNGSNATIQLGLMIDPWKYRLTFEADKLFDAYMIIRRENDVYIQNRKIYRNVAIILSVLLAVAIGSIFVFRNTIAKLQPDCEVASASVINVDGMKNKVTVTSMGREFILKGISDGNVWSYASKRINGEQIKIFIKDNAAYMNYDSLKYNTSIYGKLTNVSYAAVAVLVLVLGAVVGGYIESRKRDGKYKLAIENKDVFYQLKD